MKKVFFRLSLFSFITVFLTGCSQHLMGVLNPKGVITFEERQLLFDALALMLIVVVPVIIMSIAFVVRYRRSHKTAEYKPNWSHSVLLETIWWGVPCVIIVILGIMTWRLSHQLDPYRPIEKNQTPLIIETVALPWKWLFIYPEQHIATVNDLVIPRGRQVEFLLTTDNVAMSAFFIPQLGSQIYTMAGMRTRLYVLATQDGVYPGLNTQFNGDGFADMHFKTYVVEPAQLEQWFAKMKREPKKLTDANYAILRKPTDPTPVQHFSDVAPDLFKKIIHAYRQPHHPNW